VTTIELDAYVLDTLMPDLVGHDRQPSALIVYLFLWLQTGGRGSAQISLLDIGLGTGLSKRAVQDALRLLAKRRLVSIQRDSVTSIPIYAIKRPWIR
jgi:hypothetical protein